MNEYVQRVYEGVLKKNPGQFEYHNAVYEVLESLSDYVDENRDIEKYGIIERLVEPDRMITFRVSWVNDQGKVEVNRGYRVQFNSAVGPYKGGLRFHPSVNESIIKFLGFEQTFKNALTGLPLGGAKGGSDFDPKGKSDLEIMRFCQAFMAELYRHIGPDTDIPAGDIGVGCREIGFLFGQYKKIKNTFTGVLTGKGISYNGSLVRPEATGYGLCYFTQKMLEIMKKDSIKEKKVIISGSGNVAIYSLEKVTQLGGIVIAMSDSNGYIYSEKGINLNIIKEIKEIKKGRIEDYLKYDSSTLYFKDCTQIWSLKCDIALPCATQGELNLEDSKKLVKNGVICVCEGANMPCTIEASKYFIEHKVLFGPAKAANCGGVMVSGFEMSQNSMRLSWTFDELDEKLKSQMEKIFMQIYEYGKNTSNVYDTIKGSNIVSFKKICDAMLSQGII